MRGRMTSVRLSICLAMLSLISTQCQTSQCYGQVAQATTPNSLPVVMHHGWANLVDGHLDGKAIVLSPGGGTEPVPGALVTLLKGTQEVGSTVADADGNFEMDGLTPGSYGLLVEGEGTFAAHSIRARVSNAIAPMEVYVSTMPRSEVEAIWQSLWVPEGPLMGSAQLSGLPQTTSQSPTVRLHDGIVRGRVVFESSLVSAAQHFVKVYDQAGSLVATEQVGDSGQFAVALPGPEVYNFIVGGQAYACVSVRVVDAAGLAQSGSSQTRLVSRAMVQEAADELVISAIGPTPAGPIVEEIPPAELGPGGLPMFAPPAPMGGFAGGGGAGGGFGGAGGFGGGGGLGGLGGLLGIAGLAAGVVALSDDDDGFTPPPATPIANQ